MSSKNFKLNTVLTIAGSDPIGGAGIQADLKTISAFGLYGMSVITAVTAQNTQGVQAVYPVAPEMVVAQLDSVFTDIMPDCVKLGMLANEKIAEIVAEKLEKYKPERVVIDPVMASSSGHELLNEAGRKVMVTRLFPFADMITPNLPETKILITMANLPEADKFTDDSYDRSSRNTKREMAEAVSRLFGETEGKKEKEHAILIKGGHFLSDEGAEDYLYCFHSGFNSCGTYPAVFRECSFQSPRIDNPNTHGTGCTLSSAIACGLAVGKTVEESTRLAKEYITGAILGGLSIGRGTGPLDHFWKYKGNI